MLVKKIVMPAAAISMLMALSPVISAETDGWELSGYGRVGTNFQNNDANKSNKLANQGDNSPNLYSNGGSLSRFRLGNENNYTEFGIGKTIQLDNGVTWKPYWMPAMNNSGSVTTPQLFVESKGYSLNQDLTFWMGQRYHRIQDIHIVDNWVVQDGDNVGAGVDGFNTGLGKVDVAVQSSKTIGGGNGRPNGANRVNFRWRDVELYPGGKLVGTLGVVNGRFYSLKNDSTNDYGTQNTGVALGLMHIQDVSGHATNRLLVQGSTAHADITGEFYNLSTLADNNNVSSPGATQFRVVDFIDWQVDKLGGQALVGYQSAKVNDLFCSTNTNNNTIGGLTPCKTADYSIGGRVSYGIQENIKLLGELGITRRKVDNDSALTLNKLTAAVALSPNTNFWTRPEFRFYVSGYAWNDAVKNARLISSDPNQSTSKITVGVQVEAWW